MQRALSHSLALVPSRSRRTSRSGKSFRRQRLSSALPQGALSEYLPTIPKLLQRAEDIGHGLRRAAVGAGLEGPAIAEDIPGYQAVHDALGSFFRAAESKPLIQMLISSAPDRDAAFKILNSYISSSSHLAESIQSIRQYASLELSFPFLAVLAVVFAYSFRSTGSSPPEWKSKLPYRYDKDWIATYYAARPGKTLRRQLEVLLKCSWCGIGVFYDMKSGKWDQNAPARAVQVRELITELGASFIKIGQAVSIRPDILSPAYLNELQKLQDRVPPFPQSQALQIVEENFGEPVDAVLEEGSAAFREPVAAASLGQVYKATLKSGPNKGKEVAIKVQRPGVLESVTLDLHVIRVIFEALAKIPEENVANNANMLIGIIDAWAGRFIEELDYVAESENTTRFKRDMEAIPSLRDAVVIPSMYEKYCSRYVLTTEWVEGRKISDISTSSEEGLEEARNLVKILITTYLAQLLETGFLHSDPHPGNFLQTSDGKLCILDFGLMTEITEDQRLALVEYVAHLSAKEYNNTLGDLVRLGFIPEEIEKDASKRDIVVPLLASLLEQLSQGGGAKKINIDTVGQEIEKLSKQYPIVIPPWFGLIIRAFSTIEGIGLQLDSDYAIVDECFPYMAKRLLTDPNPRIRAALRTFVYGGADQLNVSRVEDMLSGFQNFTLTTKAASQGIATVRGTGTLGKLDPFTKEVVNLLFDTRGNYVQELLLEEAVRATDAIVKERTRIIVDILIRSEPAVSALQRTAGPLLFSLLPPPIRFLPLAVNFASESRDSFLLTEQEAESLSTLRRLWELAMSSPDLYSYLQLQSSRSDSRRDSAASVPRQISSREIQQFTETLFTDIIPTVDPGLRFLLFRFTAQLGSKWTRRLSQSIERSIKDRV